jgi:hypothetical protein
MRRGSYILQERVSAQTEKSGIAPQNTKLMERTKGIPAWDSLNADQKKVFSRMMEVSAEALVHADYQIGRILDAIGEIGDLDNTPVTPWDLIGKVPDVDDYRWELYQDRQQPGVANRCRHPAQPDPRPFGFVLQRMGAVPAPRPAGVPL